MHGLSCCLSKPLLGLSWPRSSVSTRSQEENHCHLSFFHLWKLQVIFRLLENLLLLLVDCDFAYCIFTVFSTSWKRKCNIQISLKFILWNYHLHISRKEWREMNGKETRLLKGTKVENKVSGFLKAGAECISVSFPFLPCAHMRSILFANTVARKDRRGVFFSIFEMLNIYMNYIYFSVFLVL